MVIAPMNDLKLDLWVDADFAGLWNAEDAQDPASVRSRSGFVATLGGVPVLWGSKLMTKIMLSTTEAEYCSACMAMKQFIPLRRMVKEILEPFGLTRSDESEVSIVWEDNIGVLKMVTGEYPNMTPRTKHIAVKYHWFRSHLKPGEIVMQCVDTKEQKSDICTKGLSKGEFVPKRKMIMGW
jgi:hypothetical protein